MKLLVVGRGGQVARALKAQAGARSDITLEVLGRPEYDLTALEALAAAIVDRAPDVVINAAAYTAVDKAESDVELATTINAVAPGVIARAAADTGAAVLHISTDYVYPGDKPTAYVETDPTGPSSVYGRTKLAGEEVVLAANPRAFVGRTAWVYDAEGKNFVRTMLRLATSRESVGVVDDQHGSPTFAGDLAAALLQVGERMHADHAAGGVYHVAGAGETTWASFAREIFALSAARGGPSAAVQPITTAQYPTPAKRPANSRLDCRKLDRDFGVTLRDWRVSLATCVDQIAAGGWRVE